VIDSKCLRQLYYYNNTFSIVTGTLRVTGLTTTELSSIVR